MSSILKNDGNIQVHNSHTSFENVVVQNRGIGLESKTLRGTLQNYNVAMNDKIKLKDIQMIESA